MNRTDLQKFSAMRLREAKALLKARQYSGAYYIAGYSVECALKAIIAKNRGVRRYEFPENIKTSDYYTHSIDALLKTADLVTECSIEKRDNKDFEDNWKIVTQWKETSRYEKRTSAQAGELIEAIENLDNGVLQWLKKYW